MLKSNSSELHAMGRAGSGGMDLSLLLNSPFLLKQFPEPPYQLLPLLLDGGFHFPFCSFFIFQLGYMLLLAPGRMCNLFASGTSEAPYFYGYAARLYLVFGTRSIRFHIFSLGNPLFRGKFSMCSH